MNKYRLIKEKNQVKRVEYFNEHWYQVPGILEAIPSVSSILQIVSKGFGYDEWLKSVGHEASYILREAQDSGTKLHNSFEYLMEGNSLNMEMHNQYTKKEWQKICNWTNWYSDLNIQPIAIELMVWSVNWSVGGTLDLLCEIDGEVWLLDWKTGNGVYETSQLQVAAYFKMLCEMIDRKLIDVPRPERAGLVHVGALNKTKKGMNNVGVKVVEVDLQKDQQAFADTLSVYNRFNPNAKAPSSEFAYEILLPEELTIKGENNVR